MSMRLKKAQTCPNTAENTTKSELLTVKRYEHIMLSKRLLVSFFPFFTFTTFHPHFCPSWQPQLRWGSYGVKEKQWIDWWKKFQPAKTPIKTVFPCLFAMLWRFVQAVICCDFGVVIVLICPISRFYQRGWSSTFVDALEDAKKKKDIAIERICAKNYLQLLRAVQEVHDLKAASAALKAAGRYWITCSLVFTLSIPFLHSLNQSLNHSLTQTLGNRRVSFL